VNTTETIERCPRRAPAGEQRPNHTVVTVANTYDVMEKEGAEPEIAFISPAHNYFARFEDGSVRLIALWAIMDDCTFYGVALPPDGRPPLELDNVEDEQGFSKYEHQKEDK